MSRLLLLFLPLVLLWAGLAEINHLFAPAHVYFFAGGLFVTGAALTRSKSDSLAAAIFAGALCDARAPVPFGMHLLLFAAAAMLIFRLREGLPHEHLAGRVAVALTANLALFLALSFLLAGRGPPGESRWPRLIADLACSEVFLALIAPWFFSLQEKSLALAPAEPLGMF